MTDKIEQISVTLLPGINYLTVKKFSPANKFFYSNDKSFVISVRNLSALLHHMVMKGLISPKVLEGILEEYHSTRS